VKRELGRNPNSVFTFHVLRFTHHEFMTGILHKTIVLVLNRNCWGSTSQPHHF
jgi:hypothetical protein